MRLGSLCFRFAVDPAGVRVFQTRVLKNIPAPCSQNMEVLFNAVPNYGTKLRLDALSLDAASAVDSVQKHESAVVVLAGGGGVHDVSARSELRGAPSQSHVFLRLQDELRA